MNNEDLEYIGKLCGMREDESPLKAVQRVVTELDAAWCELGGQNTETLAQAIRIAIDDARAEGYLDEGRNWKRTLDKARADIAVLRFLCAEAYAGAPRVSADILSFLWAAGTGTKLEKPKPEVIREWAVSRIDRRHGYTVEFAPDRLVHQAKYYDEEQRITALFEATDNWKPSAK